MDSKANITNGYLNTELAKKQDKVDIQYEITKIGTYEFKYDPAGSFSKTFTKDGYYPIFFNAYSANPIWCLVKVKINTLQKNSIEVSISYKKMDNNTESRDIWASIAWIKIN